MPIFHTLLTPKWPDLVQLQKHEDQSKVKQGNYFNTKHRAMPLRQLTPGIEVHITTHREPGVVKNTTENPQQYEVETPTGVIKRNRVQLISLPAADDVTRDAGEVKTSPILPELNIFVDLSEL